MTTADRELIGRAIDDPGYFARALVGQELWDHQLSVARSEARYRVICAGRQVGKSRLLAVLALWYGFRKPGQLILLVSAGETAAKRLLEDVGGLAMAAPMLRGAVVDESKSEVRLTNGSVIRAVPASARQIRGWPVDVLIVDEAGFVAQDVWQSAEPSIIARPGSLIILSSSPWGRADHFFRLLWRRGMSGMDPTVAAWHWPSITSPLVDADLLGQIRERESPTYFAREYLAEWTEDQGSYFPATELEAAVEDYELLPPEEAAGLPAIGGVDWGYASDASVLMLLSDVAADTDQRTDVWWVPWIIEQYRTKYADFIDEIAGVADHRGLGHGFDLGRVTSELNGVGAMPTQELERRLEALRAAMTGYEGWGARPMRAWVEGVHTTNQLKEDAFGALRMLIQQGRLVLPNHPGLLRQLHALEFEVTETGAVRIAVPERAGHDDLAMSLALAAWGPPGPAGPRVRSSAMRVVNVGSL